MYSCIHRTTRSHFDNGYRCTRSLSNSVAWRRACLVNALSVVVAVDFRGKSCDDFAAEIKLEYGKNAT